MGDAAPLSGPDLKDGVAYADVPEGGALLGHADGEAVLLVRPRGGDEVFAVGATCTHYSAPLIEGRVEGCEVRCPWHHARFDVRSGEASAAPALSALPCWAVERRGQQLILGERLTRAVPTPARSPSSVLIVGAGAAGQAAAEMLRNRGYRGPVTMIGGEPARPVDRPNLSKDYLAGTAPEAWVWLREQGFYGEQDIELVLGVRAVELDVDARSVVLSDGTRRSYGALLLATGADPVRLPLAGPHVHYLRSLSDSRGVIADARAGARAVVVGASFIGLEVAAALRSRGLEVDVVAPEARPLERIMGPEIGDFVRGVHEQQGVRFHLQRTVKSIDGNHAVLDDGSRLPFELVVVGVGVRPALALAEQAGLAVERGVVVNERLETSAPDVWAAGDIARWPDARSGESIRVEHWVVAERQGQTAARNMLGADERFDAVPFFWSQHFETTIRYVGHAEQWDRIEVRGKLGGDGGAVVGYHDRGRIVAVATVGRDAENLEAEALMEAGDDAGLARWLARL